MSGPLAMDARETVNDGTARVLRSPTLQSIQISRGLAALAVVFYHVGLFFAQKADIVVFGGASRYGYMGVPYFFVLSGFIISFAHFGDLGRPERLPAFVRKRFIRVYPIYWVFSVLFIIAALIGLGEPDFSLAPVELLQAAALVHVTPNFDSPPLKVAWTLFYEVRFYALFGMAILFPRAIAVLVALWMVAICLLTPFNALTFELLSFWNFAFLLGLLVCLAYKKMHPARGLLMLIAGLAIVLGTLLTTEMSAMRGGRSVPMVAVMIGFALVVLGLAQLESRLPAMQVPRSLLLLGDASYSLYLVHSAVISITGAIVLKLKLLDHMSPEMLFLPLVVVATVAGVVAHLLVEKPLLALTRRRTTERLATASAGDAPR